MRSEEWTMREKSGRSVIRMATVDHCQLTVVSCHFLLQRYNTPHPICHLLSFSIRKKRKIYHLTHRYSAHYKRWKIFQNFPLLFMQVPIWGVRTHDFVKRDTWHVTKKKQKYAVDAILKKRSNSTLPIPSESIHTFRDTWHVTRDTWQRKWRGKKSKSAGMHPFKKIKGYRCYAIRSSYNINLIVYTNIYYTSKYTRTSTYPIPFPKSPWHVTCHAHKIVRQPAYSVEYQYKTHKNQERMRRTPVLAKWNALSEVQAELSPTLALQITDYSYFETHMLPSA